MKQVNVLMEEELIEHLEKLSQTISILLQKKISISELVRKSVKEYSKFGEVTIESKLQEDGTVNTVLNKTNPDIKGTPNSDLMTKICMEEW